MKLLSLVENGKPYHEAHYIWRILETHCKNHRGVGPIGGKALIGVESLIAPNRAIGSLAKQQMSANFCLPVSYTALNKGPIGKNRS